MEDSIRMNLIMIDIYNYFRDFEATPNSIQQKRKREVSKSIKVMDSRCHVVESNVMKYLVWKIVWNFPSIQFNEWRH